MNLRRQILLGSVLLAAVPLVVAIQIIRSGVEDRFTEQDTAKVENQIRFVLDDLDRQSLQLAALLDALAETIRNDNRFRQEALAADPSAQPYLVDYAPRQMSLMNLDLLMVQEAGGEVISSGHFREAFGKRDDNLANLLGNIAGGQALITARSPAGPFLALARTRQVTVGASTFHLTGGHRLDPGRLEALNRDGDLALALVWPEGNMVTPGLLSAEIFQARTHEEISFLLERSGALHRFEVLPLIQDGKLESAWLFVAHDRASLVRLLDDLKLRMGLVLAAAIVASVFLAILLAARISLPLRRLARRTEDLDLDRLDVEFDSRRRDEVGQLTRLLGAMTSRLRDGVSRLRAAEHQATLGEVARQVNHDIRNGITPLRNVLRHLAEVARDEPRRLSGVFQERQATLEEGLAYLENLAGHYARLSPGRETEACSLAEIVSEAVAGIGSTGQAIHLVNGVPSTLPAVEADPVSLRRILDNLIRNAVESLPDDGGTITIDAALDEDPHLEEIRILASVSDTGCGIPPADLDRIFTDFYSTKEQGTGLGLSNVRRLTADCGATIRVTSEPGRGTTFTLSFPLPQNPGPRP